MKRTALLLALLLVTPLLLALRYDGVAGSVLSVRHLRTTDTCIAGYTRSQSQSNFCAKDTDVDTVWTDAGACTATNPVDTLPITATSVAVQIMWKAYANNAVGLRANEVFFESNATCAGSTPAGSRLEMREQAATAAGTILGTMSDHLVVPLVSEAGVMKYRTTQQNAGGNGNADFHEITIEGYYD